VPDPVNAALRLSSLGRLLSLAAGFFVMWIYWTLLEGALARADAGQRLLPFAW